MEVRDNVKDLLATIQSAHGWTNPANLYLPISTIYGRHRPKSVVEATESDSTYFGIEVEVENLPDPMHVETEHGYEACPFLKKIIKKDVWTMVEDNSLRNNGHEFVSGVLPYSGVGHAVSQLLDNLPSMVDFNKRAGIHIHADVSERSLAEVLKILLVYMSIEELFFMLVAPHRKDNIFCVPTVDCNNSRDMLMMGYSDRDFVSKYTALNILPIRKQGTIEFRHFESTGDKNKILLWVDAISSIIKYVDGKDDVLLEDFFCNILELRSTSEFYQYLTDIFPVHVLEKLIPNGSIRQAGKCINDALTKIAQSLTESKMPVGSQLIKFF